MRDISSDYIASGFHGASLTLMLSTSLLQAQSCTVGNSCPTNNGISCTTIADENCPGGDPSAGGDHGSDPSCSGTNSDPCRYVDTGCPSNAHNYYGCCVTVHSPIVINTQNEGFHLSSAKNGVWFHIVPAQTGTTYQVAWPVQGSHNGWLVLDRNNNGLIDDFGELFGDETPQPTPEPGKQRNGFAALAVYDKPDQGGNGDGWITSQDKIYENLRVWIDDNHDGISQHAELHSLGALGISAIRLQYELSKVQDGNGNLFRYQSAIRDASGGEANMTIYDVLVHFGEARSDDNTANWFLSPAASSTASRAKASWTPPN